MARLLIAASPDAAKELTLLLGPYHHLVFADTVEHAMEIARQEPLDAIICGMLFDDSRMYDFLRLAKADRETAKVAFICCRVTTSELPKAIIDGLETASCALGACMFLDVYALKKAGAERDVLYYVEDCLPRELRTGGKIRNKSKKSKDA